MTRAALGFTTISVYVLVRSLLWYILLSTCCRFLSFSLNWDLWFFIFAFFSGTFARTFKGKLGTLISNVHLSATI